jgi:hypothetical protein
MRWYDPPWSHQLTELHTEPIESPGLGPILILVSPNRDIRKGLHSQLAHFPLQFFERFRLVQGALERLQAQRLVYIYRFTS